MSDEPKPFLTHGISYHLVWSLPTPQEVCHVAGDGFVDGYLELLCGKMDCEGAA
jgi:hypothetical protein